MKRAKFVAGYTAIFAVVVAVAVVAYLQVGASLGERWSSLGDDGPHWPFTLFSLALLTSIVGFGVFVVLQFKQDRQDRS